MRARKARTEIRQEQIARAAMKLLAVRGWQHVSLGAIASEVGVVPSAVYRHFKSKAKVLDAVLELVDQSFQLNIQAEQSSSCDPLTRLHDVLLRHADLILSGLPVPRIILSEDVFTGSPRHRKRAHAIYRNYLAEIVRIVRDGQAQGLIRRAVQPKVVSMMWLGLVQSPAILWLLGRGDFDLKRQCEQAWVLLASAIRTDSTSAANPS